MPATIKDVARAAGVSVATVSRAMNGHSNVLPDTRERILAVARELRFTPSGAARSLITRRTDTVGALLPDLHGEYFSELIRGIDQAARARGLHLLVSSAHGDADEAAAALRAMAGRVDGVLIMAPQQGGDALLEHLAPNVPCVLLHASAKAGDGEASSTDSFTVDNVDGGRAMTAHLAAQGRRRIAFIGGPAGNREAQARGQGYREALAALSPPQPPLAFDGDFTEEAGRRVARQLLSMPADARPDAVFAANDMMAIGCLTALAEAGVAVPDAIAVGGFDDIPIARYVSPPLSTVHVPIAELGAAALAALAERLRAADDVTLDMPTTRVLPVRLVARGSSAAAVASLPAAPASSPGSQTRRASRRAFPKS